MSNLAYAILFDTYNGEKLNKKLSLLLLDIETTLHKLLNFNYLSRTMCNRHLILRFVADDEPITIFNSEHNVVTFTLKEQLVALAGCKVKQYKNCKYFDMTTDNITPSDTPNDADQCIVAYINASYAAENMSNFEAIIYLMITNVIVYDIMTYIQRISPDTYEIHHDILKDVFIGYMYYTVFESVNDSDKAIKACEIKSFDSLMISHNFNGKDTSLQKMVNFFDENVINIASHIAAYADSEILSIEIKEYCDLLIKYFACQMLEMIRACENGNISEIEINSFIFAYQLVITSFLVKVREDKDE